MNLGIFEMKREKGNELPYCIQKKFSMAEAQ